MARLSTAFAAVCLLALLCAPVVSAASSRRTLTQTATTAHSKGKRKGKGQ
jgi:acid phosphatase class B